MESSPDTATTRRLTAEIIHDLTTGWNVMLAGLPGSGRSYLLQSVVRELSHTGTSALMLCGNEMLADRPLAALSLAGVRIDDDRQPNGGSVLLRAADAVRVLAGRGGMLVVDDADGMDRLSAGVIADAVAGSGTRLLMTAPPGPCEDGPVAELAARAQPGVTVELNGLPLEDVTRLTNWELRGIASAHTVSRIAALSGGLPGLIRAIIHVARLGDRLVQVDGVWTADGDLWDEALQYSLLPMVRGLGREELTALTRLARTGGVPASEADQVAGADRLQRLSGRGLLHAGGMPSDPVVHVFPPALAEWLRRLDSGRGVSSPRQTDDAGPAAWPSGMTGPQVAAVADRIRHNLRAKIARRWARWNDNRVAGEAVPLLTALFSGAAGDDRIATVISRTATGDDEDAHTRFVALSATYRAVWGHDLAGAIAEIDRHRQASPRVRALLDGVRYRLTLICDRVPDDEPVEPSGDAGDGGLLQASRAGALIAQGRVDDAARLLDLVEPGDDAVAVMKATLEDLVLVLGSDVAGGVESSLRRLRHAITALEPYPISGHAYVAALGMCMLGRFDEVEAVVELVHRMADVNIFQSHFKNGLFLLGSFIAGWDGRRDYARNLALQAKSLGVGIGPLPGMLTKQDLLSRSSVTPDQLWDEMDDLLGRGYFAKAVFLAVAAVEMDPGTNRLAALIDLGARSQSEVLVALTSYVAAVNSQDPHRFEPVVARLRDICGPLDATRATISWALALRQRGDMAGWLERADAAWLESGNISRACSGLFDRLADAVDLTARESEVAGLNTSGLSSSEIAGRMGISTRTIEAYLHAVYRKTGVSSREELRELTTTWLTLRT